MGRGIEGRDREAERGADEEMTEPVTWAAVGMAAVSNMATWLVIIRNKNGKNTKSNNKGPKPGEAQECNTRAVRLGIIETKQSNYEEDVREIKKDIKEIKNVVGRLTPK